MKKPIFPVVWAAFICIFVSSITALAAGDDVWTPLGKSVLRETTMFGRPRPANYEAFLLNKGQLESLLAKAPGENRDPEFIISLPMPDGSLQRFRVEHSLVVEPGLLEKFPELGATYRGYGIDDPTASARFDLLPSGFHSIIRSASGTFLVDPAEDTDTNTYISFNKQDGVELNSFECLVKSPDASATRRFGSSKMRIFGADLPSLDSAEVLPVASGTTLLTYRLALAGNWEYCNAVGGGSNTIANCLAAEVLIMNRVNGVFERDVAIHMNIVANNNLITYAGNQTCSGSPCTSVNDPYGNDGTALNQNTTNLNAVIGAANYDIGHVFTTGSGGVAVLGATCGSLKGGGTTGLPNPVGDDFAIDFVAHEIGHQFGANHTFNTGCGGNRNPNTAMETGSGVTLMAYAGVCGAQDLALHSIDTFHVKSIEEIVAFSTGNGNSCSVQTATNNTPPTVSVVGGPSFTIPKQTPFALSATGSDVNGDTITYDWQEYDLGAVTTAIPNTDSGGAMPILRPYLPTSGIRYFPAVTYILNNANVPPSTYNCGRVITPCITGELLPQIGRTMTFQVIARDNRANGGGVSTAPATVVVDGTAGPFAVTAPNSAVSFAGGSQQTVTWNVANTTNGTVNAQNVDILFSKDGGLTFPFVLASSTPNDGSQVVQMPFVGTINARIKVQGSGKIFFDISDANFSLTGLTISGRVLGRNGVPVTNATVTLGLPDGSTVIAVTGRNGVYNFTGLPGTAIYTISAHSGRFTYTPQVVTLTSSDAAAPDFTPL